MPKVFVGMSGGVDSSVSALLLLEAGYDVTGVYMKNWSRDLAGLRCPWAEDLADAKRVAVKLGIDLKVYDFESDYKSRVVDYMIREYRSGYTPNPDIMCNQEVKFKLFLETALADGADLIATGHYAKVQNCFVNRDLAPLNASLLRAKDIKKDQTYFLYRVEASALAKTLFPLGDLTKKEVRQIAAKHQLITANKPDSVGICFVGQVGLEEFLSQYIDFKPGKFVDYDSGRELGWHKGVPFYTIGQRHGLELGGGLPYYVLAKDVEANIVYVSRQINQTQFWTNSVKLRNLHWINQAPVSNRTYQVRLRHQGALLTAVLISVDADQAEFRLAESQRAVTPGQSLVVYDQEFCLGGGIII